MVRSGFVLVLFWLNVLQGPLPIGHGDEFGQALSGVLQGVSEPKFAATEIELAGQLKAASSQDVRQVIQQAVSECHAAGGGTVRVPPGRWSVAGPIHLQSNVRLHLERGCTLVFSTDPNDYLPPVYTRFEGTELMNYSPPIYAFKQENVAVTGQGTLDGGASDENWWAWKNSDEEDIARLRQLAEDDVPATQRLFGEGHRVRPNFVQFYQCKQVLVEQVTLVRSPMWNLHPVLCQNVTIRGVTVNSHGPNNDGCNPESCKDVLIEDCLFDTGDDCIAIKSGRNADGRRLGIPSENIVVRRCQMKDGHGGVVLGSEMSGGIRNIFVDDCKMDSPNLERAIRLKSNSLRGGYLENMYVRNVEVGEVSDAVLRINLEYWGESGEYVPAVRNIFLTNVRAQKSRRALYLVGLPEGPIENVVLTDCRFDGAREPSVIRDVKQLSLLDYGQAPEP